MKRIKVQFEYILKASPTIVYRFLTTPECLVRWFCDSIDIFGDQYTFEWENSEEVANLIDDIEDEFLKFVWEGRETEFLSYKMETAELTRETVLTITDFCDPGEEKYYKDMWDALIKHLKVATGG